jgi:hypothetical protein
MEQIYEEKKTTTAREDYGIRSGIRRGARGNTGPGPMHDDPYIIGGQVNIILKKCTRDHGQFETQK